MSGDQNCERCDNAEAGGIMAHQDWELITVEDEGETKYFCPFTMERVRLWDEWEKMDEEEQAKLPHEKVVVVTPAVYRIEKSAAATSEQSAGAGD